MYSAAVAPRRRRRWCCRARTPRRRRRSAWRAPATCRRTSCICRRLATAAAARSASRRRFTTATGRGVGNWKEFSVDQLKFEGVGEPSGARISGGPAFVQLLQHEMEVCKKWGLVVGCASAATAPWHLAIDVSPTRAASTGSSRSWCALSGRSRRTTWAPPAHRPVLRAGRDAHQRPVAGDGAARQVAREVHRRRWRAIRASGRWTIASVSRHEIALGLEYLHGKNVLHRDLKSPNVMLTADAAGERQAKLIDFGLSKDTNSAKNKSSTIQGSSSLWMAPEINEQRRLLAGERRLRVWHRPDRDRAAGTAVDEHTAQSVEDDRRVESADRQVHGGGAE
jgi:hypothetical protein